MAAKKKKAKARAIQTNLTPMQRIFVAEYLSCRNAAKAARRAGYSENTARQIGHKMLNNRAISAAIEKSLGAITRKAELDAEKIMTQWARICESDIRKFFTEDGKLRPIETLGDDVASAIQSVEVVTRPTEKKDEDGNAVVERINKIRFWDKVSTLRDAAKHLGMFVGTGDTPQQPAPREFNIFIVAGKEEKRVGGKRVINAEYRRVTDGRPSRKG